MGVIGTAARQARKVKKLSKKATEGQKKIEKATREQRAYAKGQVKAAAATAGLAGLGLAELRSRLKEAETEKERAQLQAAIEKTMRQMAQEEGMDKKSKGGMARKAYAKGGYANCGASMKPTQKSSMKK